LVAGSSSAIQTELWSLTRRCSAFQLTLTPPPAPALLPVPGPSPSIARSDQSIVTNASPSLVIRDSGQRAFRAETLSPSNATSYQYPRVRIDQADGRNAATSASSASTTIRSALPLTLSPTVNCHNIFGLPRAKLGYERALTGIDLRARSAFFVPGCCRVPLMSMSLSLDAPGSTHPVRQREWGGRKSNGHHMLYDPPHGALHVLASVNNGAPLTDGNSLAPAQVLMRTTDGYKGRWAVVVGPQMTQSWTLYFASVQTVSPGSFDHELAN
jgi:hypothetical protein